MAKRLVLVFAALMMATSPVLFACGGGGGEAPAEGESPAEEAPAEGE